MKWVLIWFAALAGPAMANGETSAATAADEVPEPLVIDAGTTPVNLEEYLWLARPLVVFAPSENDPRYAQQIALLEAARADLSERDVVVFVDTEPSADGPLRRALHPRGFQLVLIGKDGDVKLRKPFPWDVRELSRVIDKMPMRQQEMRAR